MAIFFKIFLVQAFIFASIIFILKKILDKMLIEAALREFNARDFKAVSEVRVIVHKELALKYREITIKLAKGKCGDKIQVVFEKDAAIWGGMIIKCGGQVIDCSLIDRLRAGRFIR